MESRCHHRSAQPLKRRLGLMRLEIRKLGFELGEVHPAAVVQLHQLPAGPMPHHGATIGEENIEAASAMNSLSHGSDGHPNVHVAKWNGGRLSIE